MQARFSAVVLLLSGVSQLFQVNPELLRTRGALPSAGSVGVQINDVSRWDLTGGDGDRLDPNGKMVPIQYAPTSAPLNGTFVQLSTLPSQAIPAYIEEVLDLGIRTLVIQQTRTKGSACYCETCCSASDYRWIEGALPKLGLLLQEASDAGMDVFVGLSLTSLGVCPLSYYNNPNADLTIADTITAAAELEGLFGAMPAMKGYYLPDEPNLVGWQSPELSYRYYAGLVRAIRQSSNRLILASPFLLNTSRFSPADIAQRADSYLSATGIDILLWQDGVGADGANIDRRSEVPTVGEILAAVSERIGSARTWVVHEAFNCCVSRNPLARGGVYRPAALTRLQAQMEQVDDALIGKRMIWIQPHHLGIVDPYHHTESARLIAAYRAFYGISGTWLKPKSYQWLIEPAEQYADAGEELIDGEVGDPTDFGQSAWVGIDGSTDDGVGILMDFGFTRQVDWVGFHLLADPTHGVYYPTALSLSCSKGGDFHSMGTWHLPV